MPLVKEHAAQVLMSRAERALRNRALSPACACPWCRTQLHVVRSGFWFQAMCPACESRGPRRSTVAAAAAVRPM